MLRICVDCLGEHPVCMCTGLVLGGLHGCVSQNGDVSDCVAGGCGGAIIG